MSEIPTKLSELKVKQLKAMGFTHCVVVSSRCAVRSAGSVEAVFRSMRDAARFRAVLHNLFGSGIYEERKL